MIDRLSQSTRMLLACVISAIVIGVWDGIFISPMREEAEAEAEAAEIAKIEKLKAPVVKVDDKVQNISREDAIANDFNNHNRVVLKNDKVNASINLVGALFDDLSLKSYKESLNDKDNVVLLSPANTAKKYYAEFGWVSEDGEVEVPNSKTIWNTVGEKKDNKVTLYWTNRDGVRFFIDATLDDAYMLNVTQRVLNNSGESFNIRTYNSITRFAQAASDNAVVHEGPILVKEDKLEEVGVKDLVEQGEMMFGSKVAWQGFSDKYWLTAIIPTETKVESSTFKSYTKHGEERMRASIVSKPNMVKVGSEFESGSSIFAGAKELDLLDKYESTMNIKLFDRAVDFGVLYFITKPIFELLHFFYHFLGNFGLAILLLTVLMKLLLFPLAHKGFKGMNKLKELQPKMTELKEKYADNPAAFQQALMTMYREEKVNPMGGCLPMLLQIPVFFALYKVLYVSIEMRHAPFYGWITDLSAQDPLNLFNLFGLLPFDPPALLTVGPLALFMAVTMYAQQKLSPEPTDPSQAMVMKFLPWVFMFMFASFPSGLIIYWAWSNVLSIAQQLWIKHLEKEPVKKKSKR